MATTTETQTPTATTSHAPASTPAPTPVVTTAAAPTLSSANTSRIPLQVNHVNDGVTSSNSTNEQFIRTSRTTSGDSSGGTKFLYNMKPMMDETDNIDNRIREFRERCNRMHGQWGFADQRVPPSTLNQTPFHDSNNNISNSIYSTNTVPFTQTSPPFISSMHRSSVEDAGNGAKKYKIEFDIGDFKQNELQISTKNKVLVVKGDRELKAGSATETKTFNRELTMPDYVDMEKMTAFLHDAAPSSLPSSTIASGVNNVLIIEAPIIMEKYSSRRSVFDKQSQSPTRGKI